MILEGRLDNSFAWFLNFFQVILSASQFNYVQPVTKTVF